jgi:hypothetical protein
MLAREHQTTAEMFLAETIKHEAERRKTEEFFAKRRRYYNPDEFHATLQAIPATEPEEFDRIQ